MFAVAQGGRSRAWLVACAFAGWILVVIVAAGERADATQWLGTRYIPDAINVIMMVSLAVGLVILVLTAATGDAPVRTEKKPRRGLWALVMFAAVLILWSPEIDRAPIREEVPALLGDSKEAGPEGDADAGQDTRQPVAELSDLLLIAAGVGVVAALLMVSRRSAYSGAEAEPWVMAGSDDDEQAVELAEALDRAVEQLMVGDDPRLAVIAAYAELEDVLASHGYGRQSSETAKEHLRRSLAQRSVDTVPFDRLASLYERARFSGFDVTAQDRQSAADALAGARQELMTDV